MTKNKPVVVTGLMGSGKSTVAGLLGAALNRTVSDSDPFLQARYGMSAAEMAARDGAEALHLREAEHLLHELRGEAKVVAAAASTVESPEVRLAVREAFVVWLDAPPKVLAERMRAGKHRPHFEPDLEAMLTKMRARRLLYFEEVADLVCDVSLSGPGEVAAAVLAAMGLPAGERD